MVKCIPQYKVADSVSDVAISRMMDVRERVYATGRQSAKGHIAGEVSQFDLQSGLSGPYVSMLDWDLQPKRKDSQ